MPVQMAEPEYVNLSPWIARYRAEFLAKGCTKWKADLLAGEKARKKYRQGKIKP